MTIAAVPYFIDTDDAARPRAEYALGLLLEGIGVRGFAVAEPVAAILAYAVERPASLPESAVWIPAVGPRDWDAIPTSGRVGSLPISVDLLYATYALASGAWEREIARDRWGIPIFSGSRAEREGMIDEPLLASYAALLADALRRALGGTLPAAPRWPDGATHAVVLSHDVDDPFVAYPPGIFLRRIGASLGRRDPRDAARDVLRALGHAHRTIRLGGKPDPNFRFDDWVALGERLRARGAFYVATTGSAVPGSAPADVYYEFTNKKILAALRRAIAAGWEVGLHASINARRTPGAFARERAALESVLDGYRVTGLRHHYWATDGEWPERTWREHAAAGFVYDSSLGINDVVGFRRGMAWPFTPWDRERARPAALLQVPPTLMDGGIFYRETDAARGEAAIDAHLALVARHGGAVVLDWHMEQLNPARLHGAGPALVASLLRHAARTDVFWTTPGALADWWLERRRRIATADSPITIRR